MTAVLWLALAAQEEVQGWIDRLSSESVEERTEAARRLKDAGPRAYPALEKAAASPDPEKSARAAQILRALRIRATLPDALKREFPEVEDRLASARGAWTELLLEASRTDRGGRRALPVSRSDLDAIAAQAWREAAEERDLRAVREVIRDWGLAGAAPAVAETLASPDDALVRSAVLTLIDLEATAHAPALPPLLSRPGVKDVARGAIAFLPHPEALAAVRRLLDEDDALTGDALTIVQQARDREAVPQVRRRLKDPRPAVRRSALQVLDALGAADLLSDVRTALKDPDPEVRQDALKRLEGRDVAGLEADLHALFRDPDRDCRIGALKRIAGSPYPPAIPDLLEMLAGGDLALFAAEVLGEWADPSTLPGIRQLLREGNPADRAAAAWSLWPSASDDLLPDLTALLSHEQADVRSAGLRALVRLRSPRSASALESALDDPQHREVAAQGLLGLGRRTAIPRIAALLNQGDSAIVHDVLVRFGGRETVQALLPRLESEDAEARAWTAALLGRIGDPVAATALRRRIDDGHPGVRRNVRSALAGWAGADDLPELLEWAGDDDWSVRHAAVDALLRLRADEAAVPRLVGMLRDREARGVVLQWLAGFRAPRAAPAVASLVRTRRSSVAAPAAEVLAWWGGEGVDEALLEALDSVRPDVRRSAAWALSQRRVKAALPRLIELLEDPDPSGQQRGWICLALGELGDAAAIPVLLRELEGANCHARAVAARALGLLEAVDAIPRLRRLATEPPRCGHGGGAVPASDESGTEVAGSDRQEAALALARMGDDAALEAVFSLGPHGDLSALNRLRRPDAWARLWAARKAHVGPAGAREWPAILAAAGLRLDASEVGLGEAAFDVLEDSLWGRAGRRMAIVAPSRHADAHDVLLDDDRVRIVPVGDARRVWDAWRAGR